MRRARFNQRGDSLLEVVFALVILSIVLVGALGVARVSRANSQNSQTRAQAINLVQEQYEALKQFRDANPGGWAGFETGVRNSGMTNDPACNPNAPSTTAVNACLFHMERDPRVVPATAYGQWTACPGSWHPPLDADTGWNSGYCLGNSRTQAAQPNISVQIQLMSPLQCGGGNNFASFQISAIWDEGGSSGSSQTSLSTRLANIKGQPGC